MRLKQLENSHRLRQKLLLRMMQIRRGRVPDVVRTLLYRPEFFGKVFSRITHSVMRLSREWSVGECELFAAFVSRKNQCPF
ncbi:hypothetical protein MYX82_02195 [Acidobacteria bacterium AH-259-D05]|nr:hypothetical protein [Acidobacteria bacterium AH-259-D05]